MSTLRVNNILNATGGTGISVPGAARAWVSFNGTGTVAIRAALNVSSITDNGTGSYFINFASELPSSQYSTVFGCARGATTYNGLEFEYGGISNLTAKTTTGFGIASSDDGASLRDNLDISIVVLA